MNKYYFYTYDVEDIPSNVIEEMDYIIEHYNIPRKNVFVDMWFELISTNWYNKTIYDTDYIIHAYLPYKDNNFMEFEVSIYSRDEVEDYVINKGGDFDYEELNTFSIYDIDLCEEGFQKIDCDEEVYLKSSYIRCIDKIPSYRYKEY